MCYAMAAISYWYCDKLTSCQKLISRKGTIFLGDYFQNVLFIEHRTLSGAKRVDRLFICVHVEKM